MERKSIAQLSDFMIIVLYLTPNQIEIGYENGTFLRVTEIISGVKVYPDDNGMRAMANRNRMYLEPIIESASINN